eukprot:TRINITY_DN6774_c0_g4_i1.p1 TRINITY_DN6774_c0_g4~~TRINITY_DN6774_c0_g4_i1.p1  ORF type:complete len:146 (+),score=17.78 TRINITY_DN6774_c0_g4_i1:307-744(+)
MSSQGDVHCTPDWFVLHRVEVPKGMRYSHTGHDPHPWMSLALGEGRSLVPRHYCLRHSTETGYVLRSWRLQGSQDGLAWRTLREHKHDKSLAEAPSSVADWAVEAGGRHYRHFRVLQHGSNSEGPWGDGDYLTCCGIELYGELFW